MVRKCISIILCILITLTMYPTTSRGEVNSLPNDVNGEFQIYVLDAGKANYAGSVYYGQFYSQEKIDISKFTKGLDVVKINIIKKGAGRAQLDAVLLDENPPILVDEKDTKIIHKLSKVDYDIINIDEQGIILDFDKSNGGILTVGGRIEREVISKEPFQFPQENSFKPLDENASFYNYRLNSNNQNEPFLKEYCLPGSGHPQGYFYTWVSNDHENLYITMDVTSDNTMDGNEDYAKVNINTKDGVKVFEIREDKTQWGNQYFMYTDKVDYEHKVYKFEIPLNELGIIASDSDISLAFTVYGTMSDPIYFNPNSYAVDEDEAYVDITLTRVYAEAYMNEINLDFITGSESAVIGEDYGEVGYNNEISGTIIFKAGETSKTISIPIIDDEFVEGDEEFRLDIRDNYMHMPYGREVYINIFDNDEEVAPSPTFGFSSSNYTVNESEGNAEITVLYNNAMEEPPKYRSISLYNMGTTEVNYASEDITASEGLDYEKVDETLIFSATDTELKFIVAIINDTIIEGNETVKLKLLIKDNNPRLMKGAEVAEIHEATLTIIDDDKAITPDPEPEPEPEPEPIIVYEKEVAPDGGVIIRRPDFAPISEAKMINSVKDEIILKYDHTLLETGKYNYPRICHWNKESKKWIALTTYIIEPGKVKAINDGKYKGWFKVFGNNQPIFTDIEGISLEDICNRLNGLGVFEGFAMDEDYNIRRANLKQDMTRAEFVSIVYRLINLDIEANNLLILDPAIGELILKEKFEDSDTISSWSRNVIATMADKEIIEPIEGKFAPNSSITCTDAANIVKKVTKLIPRYKDIDLSKITDDNNELAITREKALVSLYKVFIIDIGW